jgi:hypothetical protein
VSDFDGSWIGTDDTGSPSSSPTDMPTAVGRLNVRMLNQLTGFLRFH